MKKLKLPLEKKENGNTGSAPLTIALPEAIEHNF